LPVARSSPQLAWSAFSIALNFVPSRESLFALLRGPASGAHAAAAAATSSPADRAAPGAAGERGADAGPVAEAAAVAGGAPPLTQHYPTAAEAVDVEMDAFIAGMGALLAEIHAFLSAEGQDDPTKV